MALIGTGFDTTIIEGSQLHIEQSIVGAVEEDALQQFTISIFDINSGAVASGDIDIGSISAVLSKSTGGGAFSIAGITQPTFAKSTGVVTCSYRFLAAQWAAGDMYRLVVSGITATVDETTVYIPDMIWSNIIKEAEDVTLYTRRIADVALPSDPASDSLAAFIASGGTILGTELADSKSLVDAIGSDGTNMISGDYSMGSIHQFLHGLHGVAHILFVIPEAVGSINADNTVLQTELAKLGEVVTITQADLLAHSELASYTLCVLGTNSGTAWTTSNLVDIKITPDLPLLCVDKVVAAFFEIGTDGGDAAAKTDINAVSTIKGSLLGVGEYGITGLAVGVNTVTASATYHTLTMVDADLTETWYAYETDNANTDVVLGGVYRINNDGSVGIDETGAQVAASMLFCGFAYDASELTTLGKGIVRLAALILIYERTAGLAVTLSGDIGDLETKMIGNMKTKFSNGTPLAKFIAGTNAGLGTVMPASASLYDILGIFSGDGGAAQDDSAKASLDLIHTALSGSTDAVNRAIGKLQIAATTIDLNQAAGTDTLFTGTTQSVLLVGLSFRVPNVDIVTAGTLASISIQTDDAEPTVLISAEDGALVFLEEEASLTWSDPAGIIIPTGTLIQLTIAGAAAGTTCVCNVVAQCRAIVNLGYLAV